MDLARCHPRRKRKRTVLFATFFIQLFLITLPAGAVQLLLWDYVPWRADLYRRYAAQYMAENPGVRIYVEQIPETQYKNRVLSSLLTGTGPSLFAAHPAWVSDFAGRLAPFPHDLFPPEELSSTVLGYRNLLQDGHAYYFPLGLQAAVLFINESLWEDAGLSTLDPPRSWNEAVQLGLIGTRRQEGRTEVAGLYFDYGQTMMHELFIDLNYQHGGHLFRDGGRSVALDEPASLAALQQLRSMYRSGVSGLGEALSFRENQQMTLYGYSWRQQQFAGHPDLRWTAAPLPTVSGTLHPRLARMQFHFGPAVPAGQSDERIKAAFAFLHWVISDDERFLELTTRSGTLPTRLSLWSRPEVFGNPVFNALTQTLPFSVTPGETPDWLLAILSTVRIAVVDASIDPQQALLEATEQINARLQLQPPTWVAE